MPSLDMDGPYPLQPDEIARRIARAGPGNYALGNLTKDGRFQVRSVGRDDSNLSDALLTAARAVVKPGPIARLLGKDTGADHFKFSYAQDAEAAFGKHCRTYHGFNANGRLNNRGHPKPPRGAPAKCPVCGET